MKRGAFLLALTLLLTASPWAQASGPVTEQSLNDDIHSTTRRLKGELKAVSPGPEYFLLVRDPVSGKDVRFQLDESVKLRAQDKDAFGGRKKLTPEDLVPGQKLQVTYRYEPFKLFEVKVLKEEKG